MRKKATEQVTVADTAEVKAKGGRKAMSPEEKEAAAKAAATAVRLPRTLPRLQAAETLILLPLWT